MTREEAHALVDYTWSRPKGERFQEVGGVMVTLAALCLANGLDMHAAGETELARITEPATMERIRAKQAAKPKHSPLPEHAAPAAPQPAQKEPLAPDDVERQYRGSVHIGSGLPRATCQCGFCTKHRHGFNRGNASQEEQHETAPGDKRNCTCGMTMGHTRSCAAFDESMMRADPLAQPVAVAQAAQQASIDMLLFCPKCGVQHIDGPEVEFGDADDSDSTVIWDNPPHRSHLCHHCGLIWRPADVPTNGVANIKTKGSKDSSLVASPTPLNDGERAAQEPVAWADEIIDDLKGLFDTGGITEDDSGDALVRLSDAIAAVEDAKQRAMLATPQPADAGHAWQPIETAPRDGTPILGCIFNEKFLHLYAPTTIFWAAYHPNAEGEKTWRTSPICGNKMRGVTHWMPMLATPNEGSDA
jgi:hypothetical protein